MTKSFPNIGNIDLTKQVPAKIHEAVKEDFKGMLEKYEVQIGAYKTFITDLAKEIGCTQETEVIKAEVHSLVLSERKLGDIRDNRPLTRNPFDGIGEMTRNLIGGINKLVQLQIKKLKDGTHRSNRSTNNSRISTVVKKTGISAGKVVSGN